VLVIETTPVNDQPNFKVTLSMGESGAVDVSLPNGVSITLEAGQVSSLGGVDTLIELIQTDTSVEEVLQTTLADLPATLEQLSNSQGVNQFILNIEEAAAEAAPEDYPESSIPDEYMPPCSFECGPIVY
jgi:hypothetical protein